MEAVRVISYYILLIIENDKLLPYTNYERI